jgi:TrmH family RNA methyltransferase
MLSKAVVKDIQSLAHKKFRDEKGFFIAEGPKIVEELITQQYAPIVSVYAVSDWIAKNEKLLSGLAVENVTEFQLEQISQLTTPNDVLAVLKKPTAKSVVVEGKITLVLCGIQDPGNLGTIIRIADWFGIQQIVCSQDTADCFSPKVVQATMGSIARVNVVYENLDNWLLNQKVPLYATVLDGKLINQSAKITEGIILIGNESKGIPASYIQLSKNKITIPSKGQAESLNAAVATGIVLSHLI